MKERVVFQDFNMLWAEHVAASVSPRMKDDQEEQNFWKHFMARKTKYSPDPSSRPVVTALLHQIAKHHVQTVLELGPGWGNYTIDLAKNCCHVDCIDISQDVLHFIQQIGAEQNCSNITTYHSKWKDFSSNQCYDLVFGYNCFYRQADLRSCFARMNQYAEKLCIAGMNSGLAPKWVYELDKAGFPISWEWKDYIYFIGVLYQMGIDPNVEILPFTKEFIYQDENALIQGECSRLKLNTQRTEELLDILLRSFQRLEDGRLRAEAPYHSALISWKPIHSNISCR